MRARIDRPEGECVRGIVYWPDGIGEAVAINLMRIDRTCLAAFHRIGGGAVGPDLGERASVRLQSRSVAREPTANRRN
jgi:hypothetical protein